MCKLCTLSNSQVLVNITMVVKMCDEIAVIHDIVNIIYIMRSILRDKTLSDNIRLSSSPNLNKQ